MGFVVAVVLVAVLSVLTQQASAKITASNKITRAELSITEPVGVVVPADSRMSSSVLFVPEISTDVRGNSGHNFHECKAQGREKIVG